MLNLKYLDVKLFTSFFGYLLNALNETNNQKMTFYKEREY